MTKFTASIPIMSFPVADVLSRLRPPPAQFHLGVRLSPEETSVLLLGLSRAPDLARTEYGSEADRELLRDVRDLLRQRRRNAAAPPPDSVAELIARGGRPKLPDTARYRPLHPLVRDVELDPDLVDGCVAVLDAGLRGQPEHTLGATHAATVIRTLTGIWVPRDLPDNVALEAPFLHVATERAAEARVQLRRLTRLDRAIQRIQLELAERRRTGPAGRTRPRTTAR
jgi:hypothetical protein